MLCYLSPSTFGEDSPLTHFQRGQRVLITDGFWNGREGQILGCVGNQDFFFVKIFATQNEPEVSVSVSREKMDCIYSTLIYKDTNNSIGDLQGTVDDDYVVPFNDQSTMTHYETKTLIMQVGITTYRLGNQCGKAARSCLEHNGCEKALTNNLLGLRPQGIGDHTCG